MSLPNDNNNPTNSSNIYPLNTTLNNTQQSLEIAPTDNNSFLILNDKSLLNENSFEKKETESKNKSQDLINSERNQEITTEPSSSSIQDEKLTPSNNEVEDIKNDPESIEDNDDIFDNNLPETVTLLKTADGAKIYLVGTAHFSTQSQEDVAKIIQRVKPNVVLVELCRSRINILSLDEKTILEEAKNINFGKIRATIAQNGMLNGLMYILFLSMSAHLTKELGMAPGGEFRRAFTEAKRVPMCLIHLGDRPIHITLQRALASLTWGQTLRLTWHLLMSKEPISKEDVERCKRRDLLEKMLADMAGEYPALGNVFVKERDIYLTHSLQMAALPVRTTTGVIPAKVVGVVGIGHVPGITKNWGKVDPEDIPPILKVPPPSKTSRVVKFAMKASLVGFLIWGATKILPTPNRSYLINSFKNFVNI